MSRIEKRIICLANSRKLSGRCIAGREILDGQPGNWIRPISDREHQEVSEHERSYVNGADPKVLDIIRLSLVGPRPHEYQQENWLLDRNHYWVNEGRANWSFLQSCTEPNGPLWLNTSSTFHGKNDRIELNQAIALPNSLRMISVEKVSLQIFAPGASFGNSKRRVQAHFMLNGEEYKLRITDPIYERRYLAKSDGTYQLGECCLTVSLGEPYNGYTYKLIAALIERTDVETS